MKQVNQAIDDWLDSQLLTPYNGPLPDKWKRFLIEQEYDFITLPESQYEYFGDEGYTGTLTERYNQWLRATIY